ncbi:hypothetical protein ACROYT_G044097 [Oculina patagonica]
MDTKVILGFVLLATVLNSSFLSAKLQYFTLKDKYLPGYIYKSLQTSDWFDCLQACAISERCVSYSFEKRKRSENCHLHACGFLNKCVAVKTLLASQDSVFQQLRPIEDIQNSQPPSRSCVKNENSEPIPDIALAMQNIDLCSRNTNQTLIQGTSKVFTATICGNKKKTVLDKCSKSNSKRIHLESLKYVRCNCSCQSCDEVGDLCHSSTLFLKIGRKCQGRKRCRVRITNECEDDILRSLRIVYRCL